MILEVVLMGRPAGWMQAFDGQGADEVAGTSDASAGYGACLLA